MFFGLSEASFNETNEANAEKQIILVRRYLELYDESLKICRDVTRKADCSA